MLTVRVTGGNTAERMEWVGVAVKNDMPSPVPPPQTVRARGKYSTAVTGNVVPVLVSCCCGDLAGEGAWPF